MLYSDMVQETLKHTTMQPTKKGQKFSHSDGKDILTVSCFMRTSSEHRYRTLEELKEYFNKYREDIWVMSEES